MRFSDLKESVAGLTSEVKAKLNKVTHENGSGYNRKPIGNAVDAVLRGTATVGDLIVMIQTTNNGGPVSSYRSSLPKSMQVPEEIEIIKKATSLAKKMAKNTVEKEEASLLLAIRGVVAKVTESDLQDVRSSLAKEESPEFVEKMMGLITASVASPKLRDIGSDFSGDTPLKMLRTHLGVRHEVSTAIREIEWAYHDLNVLKRLAKIN